MEVDFAVAASLDSRLEPPRMEQQEKARSNEDEGAAPALVQGRVSAKKEIIRQQKWTDSAHGTAYWE